MITREFVNAFIKSWKNAWNGKNVPALLAMCTDSIEIESPLVQSVSGVASGTLRGRQAVGDHWRAVLARFADLHITPVSNELGVSSVVIRYRGVLNAMVSEAFTFASDGKITRAVMHMGLPDLDKLSNYRSWFWSSHVIPIWNVSDLTATFEWFAKLGWRKGWDWGTPPTFGMVIAGEVQLFLCLNGQGGRGRGTNSSTSGGEAGDDTFDKGVWMSVWVDDVDAVHARCLKEGLDVTHPPTNEPWGVREVHLRHPDGHVIRISCGLEQD